MLAGLTKIEALKIDREESKIIADAVAEVASHYDTVIDPKKIAWFGLISALVTVYGSRIGTIALGEKMERAKKNNGEISGDNVTALKPGVVQMGAHGFPLDLPAVNV